MRHADGGFCVFTFKEIDKPHFAYSFSPSLCLELGIKFPELENQDGRIG